MRRDVLAGLVVVFLAWIASLIFPQGREWWLEVFASIGGALASWWGWLWVDVTTPRAAFWFLLIFFVATVSLVCVIVFKVKKEEKEKEKEKEPDEKNPLGLTDDELTILRALAESDGREIYFTHVQDILGSSRLRAEHTVSLLHSKRLIEWFGTAGNLTAYGRALAVTMGWAK